MWAFTTIAFLLAGLLNNVIADQWGYPTESPNGVIKGDENWPGTCSLGRKQSPIDLAEEASIVGRYPMLMFKDYDQPIKNGQVRNTGHSIQIDVAEDQDYVMTGGGLPGLFIMDQMHFHWSSEHTINNNRYALELHIVSHNDIYQNFTEAVKNKNGIAVLGILFHISIEPNKDLKNILDSSEPIKSGVGESSLIKTPFAPIEFLPKDLTSFYRYEGSLTTPTCDESVIWTILTDTVPFAVEQIERFKTVHGDNGTILTNNFRQLQRLNSRALVYVKSEFNSSATFLSLSIGLVIITQIIMRLF